MFLLPIGHLGGGPETVRLLAKFLDRGRYRVSVVCPESPVLQQLAEIPDITLYPLGFPTIPRPAVVRQIASLIRRERVDILHTHLFHGDLYGFLATRVAAVPTLLSTVQGINFHWEAEPLPRRYWWWLLSKGNRGIYRVFDGIATCSAAVKEAICARPGLKVRRDQIRVIHNSVDASRLRAASEVAVEGDERSTTTGPSPSTRLKRIIVVANFESFKDHPNLFQALRRLPSTLSVECLLVGDGPGRPAMEALATDLGVSERLRFTGFRHDVPALIRQSDLLVLPSLWEPFGIAIIEAMLLGVPVVACRAGGVPEILTHDVSGLLVEPGDSAALATAIELALTDSTRAHRLIGEARKVAEDRFQATQMVRAYDQWYDELSTRPAARHARHTEGAGTR